MEKVNYVISNSKDQEEQVYRHDSYIDFCNIICLIFEGFSELRAKIEKEDTGQFQNNRSRIGDE
jgi:hypothetical protein